MKKAKKSKRFYWKGTMVSEKIYKQRLAQQKNGQDSTRKRLSASKTENVVTETENNIQNDSYESPKPAEGRRIVELLVVGNQLWCTSCKERLSLSNIEEEQRQGLGSILTIRCHRCLLLNTVSTGKQHSVSENHNRMTGFDVNTKLVIGMIDSAIGYTNLNKLLTCMNIPRIDFKTYKRYKEEVGKTTENLAKQSCEDATELERKPTLEELPSLREKL